MTTAVVGKPVISLFQHFKINPLRCRAVLLFGDVVLDNNLNDVFAGWKLGTKLKTSIGGDSLLLAARLMPHESMGCLAYRRREIPSR